MNVCLCLSGLSLNVDLSLDQKEAGYFLKPLFGPQHDTSPSTDKSLFVITNPRGPVITKSHFGPFTAEEEIPVPLLQASMGNHSSILNNMVVRHLDISAHLVTRSITQDRPQLQVLFHASQLSQSQDSKNSKSSQTVNVKDNTRWCLQMHVERDEQEITSVCVLGAQQKVCISELSIPADWWDENHIHSVDVLYSTYPIDENLQCSSASNSIIPNKDTETTGERVKSYVGTVTLTNGQLTYQEVKEDQHVLIYIPQKSFYLGSKFRVPVRLQAESDLELFVVR